MKTIQRIAFAVLILHVLSVDVVGAEESRKPGIYAGAAERDISPPIGMEIMHYFRKNVGVHDPIFLRAIVLEDAKGQSFALITADLICADATGVR